MNFFPVYSIVMAHINNYEFDLANDEDEEEIKTHTSSQPNFEFVQSTIKDAA